ncbi:MAG: phosphate ABC transporter permease subunit PstC [Proteobacteria bacterium]|nr:phosphate ABC transporter permease subunit PstC [Pseudomonadota bacterium]
MAFFTSNVALLITTLVFGIVAYMLAVGRIRSRVVAEGVKSHSLVKYYGVYAALWTLVPALILALIWAFAADPLLLNAAEARLATAFPNLPASFLDLKLAQLQNIAAGYIDAPDDIMAAEAAKLRGSMERVALARVLTLMIVMMIGLLFAFFRVAPKFKARVAFEGFLRRSFFAAAVLAILITIGIVASLLFEAYRFFSEISMIDFFFGTHWSPMVSLREGAVAADEAVAGSSGSFGMVPVMLGTLLVAVIAMLVAVPVGLFSAIYTADFAPRHVRNIIKPMLEVLAGIPTVVYGFFAALTAAPFFREAGLLVGLDVSSQSALAAGGVMGIMIIPFISSLSDDVITAVPKSLRDGALGLGSTRAETIMRVVLPAAFPGLVGAFLLAMSRAVGETMIVVMAAGVAANLTINPLESVTTVTVQIVMLLTGDNEFDSVKTLSAFALGITLFVVTLLLNIAALHVSRKLGQRYE